MRGSFSRQGIRVNLDLLFAAGVLMVLLAMVMHAGRDRVYDEPWYLDTVALLDEEGFTVEFLQRLPGPAGPLYTVLHFCLRPFTNLQTPAVRLVNLGGLVTLIVLLGRGLRGRTGVDRIAHAAGVLGLPMLLVVSGMALTEMPAMVCAAGAVCAIVRSSEVKHEQGARRLLLPAVAGVCVGLAVTGRQPYLLLVPGSLFLWWNRDWSFGMLAVFLVCASALPILVFGAWGGLVPPTTAQVGAGLSPRHALWNCSYASVCAMILAPRWLLMKPKTAALFVGSVVGVYMCVGDPLITPMRTVAERLVPLQFYVPYGRLCTGVFVALGLLFAVSCIARSMESRKNGLTLYLSASTLLLLLSAAKVTHLFSSRYTATVIPVLLPLVDPYVSRDEARVLRLSIGALAGLASLGSYLFR